MRRGRAPDAASSAAVGQEEEECAAAEIMEDDDVAMGLGGLCSDDEAAGEAGARPRANGGARHRHRHRGRAAASRGAARQRDRRPRRDHRAGEARRGGLHAVEFSCDDDAVAEAFGAAVTAFLKRNRGRPPEQSDYDALFDQVRQRLARWPINGLTFDDAMALPARFGPRSVARLAAMELRIGGCFAAPGGAAAAGGTGPSSGSQTS